MSKTQPIHGSNLFEDLSGIDTAAFRNPYDALIEACENDAAKIQSRYAVHRTTRNAQQKAKMLSKDFAGVAVDEVLLRLVDKEVEPGFVDPRNCLVFWGRPTEAVRVLIKRVQQMLLSVAPNLWIMPQDKLHITALEITHSKTEAEITHLINCMSTKIPAIVEHTLNHRARLIKPMIGYDASAIALSFVPAAGEALSDDRQVEDDAFTYHHLRRDLHHLCTQTGVQVDSRYVVPSSHLTIARFIAPDDFGPDGKDVGKLIKKIEEINRLLERDFWPDEDEAEDEDEDEDEEEDEIRDGGEWIVGEESGLVCRRGRLWYGDGESLETGKGF